LDEPAGRSLTYLHGTEIYLSHSDTMEENWFHWPYAIANHR
jgi:hypothetical protein